MPVAQPRSAARRRAARGPATRVGALFLLPPLQCRGIRRPEDGGLEQGQELRPIFSGASMSYQIIRACGSVPIQQRLGQ